MNRMDPQLSSEGTRECQTRWEGTSNRLLITLLLFFSSKSTEKRVKKTRFEKSASAVFQSSS